MFSLSLCSQPLVQDLEQMFNESGMTLKAESLCSTHHTEV